MKKEKLPGDYSAFIKELAKIIKDSNLNEIEFTHDLKQSNVHIKISKNKDTPMANSPINHSVPTYYNVPASPPIATQKETSITTNTQDNLASNPNALLSPMVGIVYTAPNQDSPNFVKINDTINEGDTVLLIEAMKVFNPIKAHKSGKVTQILVKSNQAVEFNEVLLIIE